MTTWGFRFRFLLTKGHRIDDESDCLEISILERNQKLFLKTPDRNSIRESDNLIITGGGFPSKKEAEDIGGRVKNSILLCGPILRMGFDVGKDRASFCTSKFLKDEAKKIGYQVIDDVHGLCFYEQYLPVKVFGGSGSVIIGNPSSKFIEVFKKILDNNKELSEKQTLALELYNMSYFESFKRARFITLISAIECLSYQGDRSEEIVNHINELLNVTKNSSLNISDKKKLLSTLNTLKAESISESCRMLVVKRLGPEKLKEFNNYYKIRSQILHKGTTSSSVDIGTEVLNLEEFISALLISEILEDYNYLYDNRSNMLNSRHISHRKIID